MVIGADDDEKTLEEGIHFSEENIFDYLFYILAHQNANPIGKQAEQTIERIYKYIKEKSVDQNILFTIEEGTTQALTEVSQYAYEAGFKEACRLIRTLNSF